MAEASSHLFGAVAQGLEIKIQGAVPVECAKSIDSISEALEKVMELRLPDNLTVSPQKCGRQEADSDAFDCVRPAVVNSSLMVAALIRGSDTCLYPLVGADPSRTSEELISGLIDRHARICRHRGIAIRLSQFNDSFQSASCVVQPQSFSSQLSKGQYKIRKEVERTPNEDQPELKRLIFWKVVCCVRGGRKTKGRGISWFFERRSEPCGGDGSKMIL